MGKERNVGEAARVKTFTHWMNSIWSRAKFNITMDANTNTEVWTDIDTHIQEGEAWALNGGIFTFESISPVTPRHVDWVSQDNAYQLQVHRNDDHELMLNMDDDDLLYHWKLNNDVDVTTTGAAAVIIPEPFAFGWRDITMSSVLRVIFRTAADSVDLSDPAHQITGWLNYRRVQAPNVSMTRLGRLGEI